MADRTIPQIIAALETDVYGKDMRADIVDLANKLDDIVEDAVDHQLITVDATLTQSGQGADAAVTGSSIANKADASNPVFTGKLSHNVADGVTLGNEAVALGHHPVATGNGSVAIGYDAEASAAYATAIGAATVASGQGSLALNRGTHATKENQTAMGKYNVDDTSSGDGYAVIVGNGTRESRSNAATLDWDGNAWFAGTVKIGSNNKELATKDYVNSAIADAISSAIGGSY